MRYEPEGPGLGACLTFYCCRLTLLSLSLLLCKQRQPPASCPVRRWKWGNLDAICLDGLSVFLIPQSQQVAQGCTSGVWWAGASLSPQPCLSWRKICCLRRGNYSSERLGNLPKTEQQVLVLRVLSASKALRIDGNTPQSYANEKTNP